MSQFWRGFYKIASGKQVATVAVFHKGKFLCGMRRDNNRWTFPGGHLEAGEKPIDGAVRELYEEAGIKVDPKDMTHLKSESVKKPGGESLKIHAYRVDLPKLVSTSMRNDPDGEVYRWHWLSRLRPDLVKNLHVPLERNILIKALGGLPGTEKVASRYRALARQTAQTAQKNLAPVVQRGAEEIGKAYAEQYGRIRRGEYDKDGHHWDPYHVMLSSLGV